MSGDEMWCEVFEDGAGKVCLIPAVSCEMPTTTDGYVPPACVPPDTGLIVTENSVPPAPPELPETGVDSLNVALIGVSFVVAGLVALVGAARRCGPWAER